MICWIASYPRSGNTFFRLVLHKMYGVYTYSVYNDPDIGRMGMSGTVGHRVLPMPIPSCRRSDEVFFVKTHSGTPQDNSPAIYIVRDGRDAIVSHAHYRKDVERARGRLVDIMVQLIDTHPLFGGWRGSVATWSKRPHITAFVKFEELIAHPIDTVAGALSELGDKRIRGVMKFAWDNAELPTFQQLHDQFPQFFRKGVIGSWKEEMPPRVQKLFMEVSYDMMRAYGYLHN